MKNRRSKSVTSLPLQARVVPCLIRTDQASPASAVVTAKVTAMRPFAGTRCNDQLADPPQPALTSRSRVVV